VEPTTTGESAPPGSTVPRPERPEAPAREDAAPGLVRSDGLRAGGDPRLVGADDLDRQRAEPARGAARRGAVHRAALLARRMAGPRRAVPRARPRPGVHPLDPPPRPPLHALPAPALRAARP